MMKLLLLFNEFFWDLGALHQNLNFLEQTCTFLHLLTQLSSLSFLFCCGFFVLPWLSSFVVTFFILPWLFCFAVHFLFCRDFFLFCRGYFILPCIFHFAEATVIFALLWHFVLLQLFCFAVHL